MKYIIIALPLLVLTTVKESDSARILAVFPVPSISHQVVFRPITEELARRGHDVVVVTPDPVFAKSKSPPNLTEIDVNDMSYKLWEKFHSTATGKKEDLYQQLQVAFTAIKDIVKEQLQFEPVARIIKEERDKFDLLLIEAVARPALVLMHLIKVPTILVSSFGGFHGNFEAVGAPTHPFLYPFMLRQKINDLTFYEKIVEFRQHYELQSQYEGLEEEENEMIRKNFGNDVPPLRELRKKVDMLFLNTYPIWDSNRPVPPSVVYMGGLHQKPVKDLPQDLKSYLDESKNGVIYISFGTNVSPSLLPSQKIQILIKTFSELPFDVLWKWDKDVLPGKIDNIRIGKWFPQSDLLRHPKIKLFITQGGLQSTDEALTAGVPLLGIPLLGDQWYNVEMYVKHKIGKRLDMDTLTVDKVKEAIIHIINDDGYHANIKKLRSVMVDTPMAPLDRAVWWVEHVLRHKGAGHLRSPAANITWPQYLELPLLLTLITLVTAVALVAYAVWRRVVSLIFGLKKVKTC